MKKLLLFIMLLVVVLPVNASEDECVDCLVAMVATSIYTYDYSLRQHDFDRIAEGDYMRYNLTLYRGTKYMFVGCGDSNCKDLDFYLYDENGNLIDRDRKIDNKPIVEVTPRWTGTFRLYVKMYDTRYNGSAWYGMAVLYK